MDNVMRLRSQQVWLVYEETEGTPHNWKIRTDFETKKTKNILKMIAKNLK